MQMSARGDEHAAEARLGASRQELKKFWGKPMTKTEQWGQRKRQSHQAKLRYEAIPLQRPFGRKSKIGGKRGRGKGSGSVQRNNDPYPVVDLLATPEEKKTCGRE